jgi:hypothetical protein
LPGKKEAIFVLFRSQPKLRAREKGRIEIPCGKTILPSCDDEVVRSFFAWIRLMQALLPSSLYTSWISAGRWSGFVVYVNVTL